MANASGERAFDVAGLEKLLERTERAIAELEAQNAVGDDPPPARLSPALTRAERLREQMRAAMKRLAQRRGPAKVNLTDGDAHFVKGRSGIVPGYNAQAVVSPLRAEPARVGGSFIIAAH